MIRNPETGAPYPPGSGEVSATDFSDERLANAFSAIAPTLAEAEPGAAIDVSKVSDREIQGVLRSLVRAGGWKQRSMRSSGRWRPWSPGQKPIPIGSDA